MRLLWLFAGLVSIGLGMVGAVLPLLPTVPFLLLAAFFFARSSERLHNWLLTHPSFGAPIIDWQERGAISRRAKWIASLSMVAAFGISLALGVPPIILLVQAIVLSMVALFIWTRPEA
ncbi:MAG: YbaN family protein [Paracoccaceae bacterium]